MTVNDDQRAFWSKTVGDIWVAQATQVDATFAPVLGAVLEQANLKSGEAVLDIGCGAGASSFAAARLVGDQGRVCGVDVSAPLLQAAGQAPNKTGNTTFVLADAQTHSPKGAPFDCMISRFGVMFFENPVEAFRNIANSLRSGGRFAFATWGAIGENPFFTLPAAISKAHIGPMPKSDPDAPGPFSMRDTAKVITLLKAAGLSQANVAVRQMSLTPVGTAQDVAALMCEIGPAKNALTEYEVDQKGRTDFVETLAGALKEFDGPSGILIPAEINIFSAGKP